MTNSCWGQVWGGREVNSLGHKPGMNTKCSEEWGRLTQPLLAPLRGPLNSLARAGSGAEGPGPGAGTGPPGWEDTCTA